MAANFPSNPSVGDTATVANVKYQWNGDTWIIVPGDLLNNVVQSNNGAIDLSKGSWHKILIDANNSNVSISFSNIPSGSSRWFLEMHVTASYTINWPASIVWKENTSPTTSSNQTIILDFYTSDGGTTIYGIESINRDNTPP